MYKNSLPTANLKEAWKLSSLTIGQVGEPGLGERKVWKKTLSDFSELEVDLAEWNSLETEIMGGRMLTAGCSAVGIP